MKHFTFIATDIFDLNDFNDVERFVDSYPDFQTVLLENENDLKLLLELQGIKMPQAIKLNECEFSKYWDLSNQKFLELNDTQFDQFYSSWIQKSKGQNTMDEFGNLIFLQAQTEKWNKLNFRLVIQEDN